MQPLVSICCITYNHAPYIRQCLDGFLMQKTNFPLEVIINDDCSTDGTTDIIREYELKYPNIIKPIYHDENLYSKGIRGMFATFCFPKARGKYIALCEGDDYWIDVFKLQKQIEYLEKHSDCGLVHTYVEYVNTYNQTISPPTDFYEKINMRIFDGFIWGYYLRNSGFILTCSSCFRKELLKDEIILFDHGLFMSIARQKKIYCLREKTVAYRRNPEGAMMTQNKDHFMRLTSRTRLLQLYYYYKNGRNLFYNTDKETKSNIAIAFYAAIYYVLKYDFRTDLLNKLFYVFINEPLFYLRNLWVVCKKM